MSGETGEIRCQVLMVLLVVVELPCGGSLGRAAGRNGCPGNG